MAQSPTRVGLIGLGAIATGVVDLIHERAGDDAEVVAALVRDAEQHTDSRVPRIVTAVSDLLETEPDVIVEAAGHEALRSYGPAVVNAGCDLLLVSVGALADEEFSERLRTAAREHGCRIRIMSGAIGGLDAVGAAAVGGLERVTHITRKPPHSLLDASAAAELSTATEIFRGSAREGAARYPESINVAAAVSLAGIGLDRTEVVVLADPNVDRNQHEVEVEGIFGCLRFAISNIPNEQNPRSTKLVAMSIVHNLLQQRAVLTIG